jgi:mRNA turnover protein 4
MVKLSSSSKQKQTARASSLLQKSQPYAPKKKDKEAKAAEIGRLCDAAQSHTFVYVGEPHNIDGITIRTLKDFLRKETGTTIMYSKNTLARVALGKDEASEVAPGLAKLAASMTGNVCLLFSESKPDVLDGAIKSCLGERRAFIGAGAIAPETVTVPLGPCPLFTSTQEPLLRRLGAPVTLDRGVIVFSRELIVCTAGEVVSAAGAKLLRLLSRPLAVPALRLLRVVADGKYLTLASPSSTSSLSLSLSSKGKKAGGEMEVEEAERESERERDEADPSAHAVPPAPRRSKKHRESKPLKISRRKR